MITFTVHTFWILVTLINLIVALSTYNTLVNFGLAICTYMTESLALLTPDYINVSISFNFDNSIADSYFHLPEYFNGSFVSH